MPTYYSEVQTRTSGEWEPLPLAFGGRNVHDSTETDPNEYAATVSLVAEGAMADDRDWRAAVWRMPRDGRDPDGAAGVIGGVRFCGSEEAP